MSRLLSMARSRGAAAAAVVCCAGALALAFPVAAAAQTDPCAPRPGVDPRAPQYICALYELFLHPPTAEEVDFLLGSVDVPPGAPVDLNQVVQAVSVNQEANLHLVGDLYDRYLHRPADTAGLQEWVRVLLVHATRVEQVEVALATSAEYRARTPGVEGFVASLYADVLGREPAAGEADVWVQLLGSGTATHELVAGAIIGSEEASALRATGLYELLGRPATAEEISYWAAQIRQHGYRLAQASFLGSAEAFATL